MSESRIINLGIYRRRREYGAEQIKESPLLIHYAFEEIIAIGKVTRDDLEKYLEQCNYNLDHLVAYLDMTKDDFLELGLRRIKRQGQEHLLTLEAVEFKRQDEQRQFSEGRVETNALELLERFITYLHDLIQELSADKIVKFKTVKYLKLLKKLRLLREQIATLKKQEKISLEQEVEFERQLTTKVIINNGIENLDFDQDILPLVKAIFALDVV